MPAPGATTADLMLAMPGVVAAAAARLLLQVLTPATPGAAVLTPAMPGVVAARLLLLLLVAGRLVAPPLVVAAGKEVELSFCPVGSRKHGTVLT